MKYLALLAVPAVVYLILARETPVGAIAEAVGHAEVAPLTTGSRNVTPEAKSGLKRPIDRTQQVLKQVGERNGTSEF
ncbi:MAG TPA: hypothetical protein VGO90_09085 [Chthoniobacteraceae bacterium]|jgi:hypothetical protein|nr:hypothetical protein [Chthoniobacteraceae bacterium]